MVQFCYNGHAVFGEISEHIEAGEDEENNEEEGDTYVYLNYTDGSCCETEGNLAMYRNLP